MKIEIINYYDKSDYRSGLDIKIDGEKKFSLSEGEPEDMTLSRDLNDCYKIGDLLKQAHKAGKEGEELEISNREVDWDTYLEE